MSHFNLLLQDGNAGLLPRSTGPGFIPSGSSSLSGSVATAHSVHVRRLHQWGWQGKRTLNNASLNHRQEQLPPFVWWWSVSACVPPTATLLVGASCWKHQHHGSPAAVCSQRPLASVRGTFLAFTPIAATRPTPLTTRNSQIFTGAGQHPLFCQASLRFIWEKKKKKGNLIYCCLLCYSETLSSGISNFIQDI